MKKRGVLIFFLIFTIFSIQIYSQTDNSFTSNQEELEIILEKCAEYCERVKSIALFYVCREEIQDKINYYLVSDFMRVSPLGSIREEVRKGPKLERIRNNSFIYDYQLIKEEEKLLEKRTLLEKNNRKRRKKNAQLEVRLSSEYLVYGPVGFLSQYWQDYFYYEIIGQERINNILATVIKATPNPNNEDNRNFAQLWINEEDGSILQIEWQPESIIDHKGNLINLQALDFEVNVEWRVTYGVEKNGVRFPDQQHIQEFLVSEEGEKFLQNEIFILYNNYKFFIVETEIKYKS